MKTIKITTSLLLTITFIVSNMVIAQEKLPFLGTRSFNFYMGSGTGHSITIKKDGSTTVKIHGTVSTEVLYRGKFANPIVLKDGTGWLLKGNKIYALTNGKIDNDCRGDGKPCESELFKE